MARRSLTLLAIAIPLTLAACGGDDDDDSTDAAQGGETSTETTTTTAAGPGGVVTLRETEFKIEPSDPTTKPGTVTFDVTNNGSTIHDLEVEGNGVEAKTDPIESGDTARLAVDLSPGTYEIYCTIDDHREQGMEGTLTVR